MALSFHWCVFDKAIFVFSIIINKDSPVIRFFFVICIKFLTLNKKVGFCVSF